jgi:hypothetical protein
VRQCDVEDGNVRLLAAGVDNRFPAIAEGTDHPHVGSRLEQATRALAHQRVIVDQDDADHKVTIVSARGARSPRASGWTK